MIVWLTKLRLKLRGRVRADDVIKRKSTICPRCLSVQGNSYCNSWIFFGKNWQIKFHPEFFTLLRLGEELNQKGYFRIWQPARLNCPLCDWNYRYPLTQPQKEFVKFQINPMKP